MFKAVTSLPFTRTLHNSTNLTRLRLQVRTSLAPLPSQFCPFIIQQRMPLVTSNHSVIEILKKNEIIPDVVDEFNPTTLISVSYSRDHLVNLGDTLSPNDTKEKPHIQITPEPEHEGAKYTLVMTDPDAPSRKDPKWSEFCHWISSDIKLPSLDSIASAGSFNVSAAKGEKEIIEYMGPAPPDKTGKHRYVFLLYRHGSDTKDLTGPKERKNWGTGKPRHGARQWAKDHDLTLVGANFFFAEHSK
ncbi:phosphatidylethanolamine-binding protein [Tirmania nivea]|nr:phosphatidylethanolamine-binding protein [Tirmania nivea]